VLKKYLLKCNRKFTSKWCYFRIHLEIKDLYGLYIEDKIINVKRDRRGRDRMVDGFTTTCAISAYHH